MKPLIIFIQNVRSFLEPHWIKAHEEWKDIPIPNPPSKHMCRYSSLFLKQVLNENNYGEWEIISGRPLLEKEGTSEGKYGYKSLDGNWNDHTWLINGNLLVDITSDQFGGRPVHLGEADSDNYNANLTEEDILFSLTKLKTRVSKWLD